MISKNIFYTFSVFLLLGFVIFYFNSDTESKINPYLVVTAILITPILKFIFPKLRKLGIGTADFYPNLYKELFKYTKK